MKTLSSKEDEFSLSLKVNYLIMVVVIISVMRIINVTGCKFLKDVLTFYTFIKTEDCDSNSEEGDNWSFAALNLGRRIISSNQCLTLFLYVSVNKKANITARVNLHNFHHCTKESYIITATR